MIGERMQSIPDLAGRYRLLDKAEVGDLAAWYVREFVRDRAASFILRATFDSSDLSRASVAEWLRPLLAEDDDVVVYWPADGEGAAMKFGVFVSSYDDLWYPGADDVIVVGPGKRQVLRCDHEEQLSWLHARELSMSRI